MHTISRRVKPASPAVRSARPADDIGCRSGSTFLTSRAVRNDVEVGPMLSRRAVDIGVAPRIVGDSRTFQIRAVPRRQAAGTLHQRSEPFRAVRVPAVVEEIQIERTGEALDL